MTGHRLDIWAIVVLAVVGGQMIKLLLYSVTQRRLRLSVLGQSAGLPSAHAVGAGSLVGACWQRLGWSSPLLSVALVFAVIMVFDAMRVRSAADQQRRVLRDLVQLGERAEPWRRMVAGYLDALTHTPTHVMVGLAWGFLFAFALGTA